MFILFFIFLLNYFLIVNSSIFTCKLSINNEKFDLINDNLTINTFESTSNLFKSIQNNNFSSFIIYFLNDTLKISSKNYINKNISIINSQKLRSNLILHNGEFIIKTDGVLSLNGFKISFIDIKISVYIYNSTLNINNSDFLIGYNERIIEGRFCSISIISCKFNNLKLGTKYNNYLGNFIILNNSSIFISDLYLLIIVSSISISFIQIIAQS